MNKPAATKLLDSEGLKTSAFDPVLADALGNTKGEEGCKILAETVSHGRAQVQLRDWLYCLARAAGSLIRKRFIDRAGLTPQEFVGTIEAGVDGAGEPRGTTPDRLASGTVADSVAAMLATAEHIARDSNLPRIGDAVLTLALFECADDDLKDQLNLWDPDTEGFVKSVRASLVGAREDSAVFHRQSGALLSVFEPSGKKLCQRMLEDACSLGAQKLTTRHMLYTLLGNENGLLATTLAMRGVNVKSELHAQLARELTRRKRSIVAALTRGFVFDPVNAVLEHALVLARRRGAPRLSESDVHRAFAEKQIAELARLFPPNKPVDTRALADYLQSIEDEPEGDEQETARAPLQEIEKQIKQRICGQEEAADRIMPWIKRLRFGLPRDGRPAAVLLLLGPTGAGKTQMAKELARWIFGTEEEMLFMEMGQFQTKESMSGFIGAPPGYIGYGEGKLTNGLRDKPECVVLFDEIEKAATSVFDVLLRFCDEGMISDPAGPVRDGRRCIIVLTTNCGQAAMREAFKSDPEMRKRRTELGRSLLEWAKVEMKDKGFRPEFIGRVDEVISFLPFTIETCRKIVDQVLERELEKFARLKDIYLNVTEEAREYMAQLAFDKSIDEGARGAPRAVNSCVVTPAIDFLSSAEDKSGDSQHLMTVVSTEVCDAQPDGGEPSQKPATRIRIVNLDAAGCRQAIDGALSCRLETLRKTGCLIEVAEDLRRELATRIVAAAPGQAAKTLSDGVASILTKAGPPVAGAHRILTAKGVVACTAESCRPLLEGVLAAALQDQPGVAVELDKDAREMLLRDALAAAGQAGGFLCAAHALIGKLIAVPARAMRPAAAGKSLRLIATVKGLNRLVLEPI